MKKRLLSSLLTLCMVMSLLPTAAFAADTVYGAFTVSDSNAASYVGNVLTVTKSCTISMAAGTATTTDRIVVNGGTTAVPLNITLSGVNIDVSGKADLCAFDMTGATVHLTLEGTNTLKSGAVKDGLRASAGATLTIDGTGTIYATGGFSGAGIGVGSGSGVVGGTITILGGTIYATGGSEGAGIGGRSGSAGGKIAILGGKVTATGNSGGAGIGGGYQGAGGEITISADSTVIAVGAYVAGYACGAGIGGGGSRAGGKIAISGGTVTATGGTWGAGIGGGGYGAGGNITISAGTVTATGGDGAAGIGSGFCGADGTIAISGGTVTATGKQDGDDIGKGAHGTGGTITITGGSVKATNGSITTPTNGGTAPVYLAKLPATGFTSGTATPVKVGSVDFKIPATHVDDPNFFYLYLPVTGTEVTATLGAKTYTCTVADNKPNVFAEKAAPATNPFTVAPSDAATYDNHVLTVTKSCTISMAAGATTTDSIKVPSGITANITLSGVNIQFSDGDNSTEGTCAFDMTGATVNLTLEGTNTLKSGWNKAGLQAPAGATLTIDGTGTLNATGGVNSAGIGGGGNNGVGGNITISGGTVTATGGAGAAGIGGGGYGAGGIITISGGTVTATAGTSGQDIGNGAGGAAGTTTITGGSVKAATSSITTPTNGGTTPVYLAKLPATGFTSGNDIKVKVGSVDFKIPAMHDSDANFYLYLPVGVAEATVGTKSYTCTVANNNNNVFAVAPAPATSAFTVAPSNAASYDNHVLTVRGDCTISMAAGATTTDSIKVTGGTVGAPLNITLSGVNIDVSATAELSAFDIADTAVVNLTLEGTNTLKSGNNKAGLQAPTGATLTIGGTGRLNATGGNDGAGIGTGSNRAGGTITINGGTVTATGGTNGAGIGGGSYRAGGTTTINGGTISATGGGNGAGIGGGYQGAGGTIAISGGTISATGKQGGADIGTGAEGTGGTTKITGGSVKAINGNITTPTTDVTTAVYLAKLPATGFTNATDTAVKVGNIDFKIPAKHDSDDNFYLYLPATGTEISASVGTTKYTCTVNANNSNVFAVAQVVTVPNWTDEIKSTTDTWDNGGTIGTAAELAQFAYNVNNGKDYAGKTITLSNDISLSDKEWTPIGYYNDDLLKARPFKGTFDGQGKKITGIAIGSSISPNATLKDVGLFGCVAGGTIKNLGVNVSIHSRASNVIAGGLVGVNTGAITNCYATGNINIGETSDSIGGGLVGVNSGTITNSYATVNVSGGTAVSVGGLVGHNEKATITNCYATGDVSIKDSTTASHVGGLVGHNSKSKITNCYWNSDAVHSVNNVKIGDNEKKGVGDDADTSTKKTSSEMKAAGFVATLNTNVYALNNPALYTWKAVENGYPTFTLSYAVSGTVLDSLDAKAKDVNVKLMKGNTQIGSQNVTTDANGKFTITGVPNGTYNLVAAKDGIVVTKKVIVNGENCILTDAIKLPAGKTNSVVQVEASTPDIVVGNLDAQFLKTVTDKDKGVTSSDQAVVTSGGSVEIKLTAKKKDSTAPNAGDISATASSNGKTVGIFVDLSVLKTVKDNSGNELPAQSSILTNLPSLIEVLIPLDASLQGKSSYVVYRYHGASVDTISTLANTDGEKIELMDNGATIKLSTKKFSTYAIGYQTTTPPVTPPTGGSSGGGSGSSVASSTLTAEQSKDGNITISTDKKTATMSPNNGYVIADVMVDGKSIGATKTYTVTDSKPHKITAVYVKETALPYYTQSSGTVYIGFSALADQCYKYIAPSGVKVEFKENAKNFVDNTIAWAKPSIDFVTERELFLGTTQDTFGPNESMTRAMFVAAIGRLYEHSYGNVSGTSTFSDVDANAYYAKYVAWANEKGVIKGIGENKFAPNEKVTREQMAVIMRNFATLLKKADGKAGSLAYADSTTIASWAIDGAKYCQATKVITGRNASNFAPQESATRAEVAVVMERFIKTIVK